MILRNFLDEKVLFLQVAIILTYFQSEKSQHKLDLMQSVLLKRFTKRLKVLNFWGSKAKKSYISNFPLLFLPESVPKHYFATCQDFLHLNFEEKHLNCLESMQSLTNYQFRFKTGSWCIAEYYSPKSDGCVWHNKIIPIQNVWFIGSKATKHWNREP